MRTRPISWVKAARKDFDVFPDTVRIEALRSLTIAAEGYKSDNAKPLTGLGAGILKSCCGIARLPSAWSMRRGSGNDLWVVHAFQKKSKSGIKTPRFEIDLIRSRISGLKEQLQ